jgi:hypothetical protein
MNSDNSLQFELYYEGRMVTCRVDAGESDYGIHFDGELVAVIEMDDNGLWEAQGDALEVYVANEIGQRIEEHYE